MATNGTARLVMPSPKRVGKSLGKLGIPCAVDADGDVVVEIGEVIMWFCIRNQGMDFEWQTLWKETFDPGQKVLIVQLCDDYNRLFPGPKTFTSINDLGQLRIRATRYLCSPRGLTKDDLDDLNASWIGASRHVASWFAAQAGK